METLSKVFYLIDHSMSQSYNPNNAETLLVWAVPFSFATTKGITDCFLFLRVLRCFSSPGLPPFGYYTFSIVGCPIRKSSDHRLCASHRSLSQLVTSFIASKSQGIHRTPLLTFLMIIRNFMYLFSICQRTFIPV